MPAATASRCEAGALRSWPLDGSAGPFEQLDAGRGGVWALEVVEFDGAPLIVSAGEEIDTRAPVWDRLA